MTFVYLIVCILKGWRYLSWTLDFLKTNLLLFLWIFYAPAIECALHVAACESNGTTTADSALLCYSGLHSFLLVISVLVLLFSFIIALVTAALFQKTEATSDDAMAQ